jgi:hypothetical protein
MDPVIVFRTFDLGEAEVIKSRLESAGIPVDILHENSAALLDVAVGGARISVPSDRVEEAKALIADTGRSE